MAAPLVAWLCLVLDAPEPDAPLPPTPLPLSVFVMAAEPAQPDFVPHGFHCSEQVSIHVAPPEPEAPLPPVLLPLPVTEMSAEPAHCSTM